NVAPGKERREYVEDGNTMVMILRHDKKVIWMLMPENKTYMEMKFPKEGRKDDIGSYTIDSTTIGPETVNGVTATKSKVIMTSPNGDKMGGFWWATKEGIIVKLDALSVSSGGKERMKTYLENLKVGKQDASLFEIPSDYTKMDMMGGMGSMMLGGDDDDDNGAPEDVKPQPKSKKRGFSFKDAIDLIK
ncbi:MAG: DUF4412 domain-containing protein, partial [Deltaproteobacteria bacterium]|nr:DUF4412 domain-containing protein [Deltaproteobacteria bacterium]